MIFSHDTFLRIYIFLTAKMVFIQIELLTPKDYIGALMELAQDRRGEFKEMKYIAENRASLLYELPLAEVRFCLCKAQIITMNG